MQTERSRSRSPSSTRRRARRSCTGATCVQVGPTWIIPLRIVVPVADGVAVCRGVREKSPGSLLPSGFQIHRRNPANENYFRYRLRREDELPTRASAERTPQRWCVKRGCTRGVRALHTDGADGHRRHGTVPERSRILRLIRNVCFSHPDPEVSSRGPRASCRGTTATTGAGRRAEDAGPASPRSQHRARVTAFAAPRSQHRLSDTRRRVGDAKVRAACARTRAFRRSPRCRRATGAWKVVSPDRRREGVARRPVGARRRRWASRDRRRHPHRIRGSDRRALPCW